MCVAVLYSIFMIACVVTILLDYVFVSTQARKQTFVWLDYYRF